MFVFQAIRRKEKTGLIELFVDNIALEISIAARIELRFERRKSQEPETSFPSPQKSMSQRWFNGPTMHVSHSRPC